MKSKISLSGFGVVWAACSLLLFCIAVVLIQSAYLVLLCASVVMGFVFTLGIIYYLRDALDF